MKVWTTLFLAGALLSEGTSVVLAQPKPILPETQTQAIKRDKPVPQQNLAVVMVVASSQRSTNQETQIGAHLEELRKEWKLSTLKVLTLHLDNPAEAEIATRVFDVSASDTPAVCLARLDPNTHLPVESRYRQTRLELRGSAAVDHLIVVWASQTGVTVPLPTDANQLLQPAYTATSNSTYDPSERISNVGSSVEKQALHLYLAVRGLPLQPSNADEPARLAVLSVLENARLVDQALARGTDNPRMEMEALLGSGLQLSSSGAATVLPSDLRPAVEKLTMTLALVQQIYTELNPTLHSSGQRAQKTPTP
jgi:hypothetical protein